MIDALEEKSRGEDSENGGRANRPIVISIPLKQKSGGECKHYTT
jgi:hypothetical protein